MGSGSADACGGGSTPDELAALRPARDVLIIGGIVPVDERHIVDVDAEQVKPTRLGPPTKLRGDDIRVLLMDAPGLLGDCAAPQLELATRTVPRSHDAVNED